MCIVRKKKIDEKFYVDKNSGKVVKKRDDKISKTIVTLEVGFAVTTCKFYFLKLLKIYLLVVKCEKKRIVDSFLKVFDHSKTFFKKQTIFFAYFYFVFTVPYLITLTLINNGVLNCDTLPVPNLVTFYLFYARRLNFFIKKS